MAYASLSTESLTRTILGPLVYEALALATFYFLKDSF